MLERYFVRPDTVDRILASWIGGPVERYVGWLAGHGYATRTVLRRVPILVGFGAFAADRGAARCDDLPAHVDAFVANWLRIRGGGHATAVARRKDANAIRNMVEQMLLMTAVPSVIARTQPARSPVKHLASSPICGTSAVCARRRSGTTASSCAASSAILGASAVGISWHSRRPY